MEGKPTSYLHFFFLINFNTNHLLMLNSVCNYEGCNSPVLNRETCHHSHQLGGKKELRHFKIIQAKILTFHYTARNNSVTQLTLSYIRSYCFYENNISKYKVYLKYRALNIIQNLPRSKAINSKLENITRLCF